MVVNVVLVINSYNYSIVNEIEFPFRNWNKAVKFHIAYIKVLLAPSILSSKYNINIDLF